MTPGIYTPAELSNERYHAGPGVSNTMLNDMRPPAKCYALHVDPHRPPDKERAGQLEGNLAHCAILEPDEFEARYCVLPANAPQRLSIRQINAKNPSAATEAARHWWEEWEAEAAGKITITHGQRETALRQGDAARTAPELSEILSRGVAETSAYWIDDETGELCRCRPDWVHPLSDSETLLLDVKTYTDADPMAFRWQIRRKGYHRQNAYYSDGYAIASETDVVAFVFAAVSTEYPYLAGAVMLDQESVEVGRFDYRERLDRFAECKRSGVWPGFGGIEVVSIV